MPILVTLTTDLGERDYYSGILKGAILSRVPDAQIVDVSHAVDPFDILQGAYILKNSFHRFPPGTIHMILVDSSNTPRNRFLCVQHEGHYFLGPDNGILSLLFDDHFQAFLAFESQNGEVAYDQVFLDSLAGLAAGQEPAQFLSPVSQIVQRTSILPVISGDIIRASVIYIDRFQNVVLNVKKQQFLELCNNRSFEINFNKYFFTEIVDNYSKVSEGDALCLFNSSDYLEIAINKGRAASLLGLELGATVLIEFK